MIPLTEYLVRSAATGTGATLAMDLWLLALKSRGVPTLDFALLGRWVGHIPRGRWFHPGMAQTPAIPAERALGWLAHYAIGIAFAALLLALAGPAWAAHPTLLPALAVGTGTVVAPLFVMQPAMGAGICARRTKTPVRNVLRSIANHTVFGLGLYAAARITAHLV